MGGRRLREEKKKQEGLGIKEKEAQKKGGNDVERDLGKGKDSCADSTYKITMSNQVKSKWSR